MVETSEVLLAWEQSCTHNILAIDLSPLFFFFFFLLKYGSQQFESSIIKSRVYPGRLHVTHIAVAAD